MHRRYSIARAAAASVLALAALVVPRLAAAAEKYPAAPNHLDCALPGRRRGRRGRQDRGPTSSLPASASRSVIDNRGGAAGVIGMRMGARAANDGYTLVLAHTGSTSINPSLYANAGYDPRADFAPIGLISSTPVMLMAYPAFAASTIAELIAMAKKEPGKINFGTPPPGTGGYLAAELFKSMSGAEMTIIPYKGTAALTTDLLGGHVSGRFQCHCARAGQPAWRRPARRRGRGPRPVEPVSRRADRERERPAGLRSGLALRPAGAGRHLQGDHRATQQAAARAGGVGGCARTASPPMGAIRCRRARSNMPPTSTRKRRSGRS